MITRSNESYDKAIKFLEKVNHFSKFNNKLFLKNSLRKSKSQKREKKSPKK